MGHFNDVDGVVNYDINAPSDTSMSFTVAKPNIIDTNWDARDEHLRNEDFFRRCKSPDHDI